MDGYKGHTDTVHAIGLSTVLTTEGLILGANVFTYKILATYFTKDNDSISPWLALQ